MVMRRNREKIFWQIYANVYDLVRFIPPYRQIIKDVKEASNIRASMTVLDAGCGTGNFIKEIAAEADVEIVGIDISQIMLAKAKKKIGLRQNVKLRSANLNEKLYFNNDYFDRIIAVNSIYAVYDPQFTLSELIRVLKPGGILVMVNPHSQAKFITTYFQIINSGKGLQKVFLFTVTLPLLLFNLVIKFKASKKDYHFLSQENWKNIVNSFNIKSLVVKEADMQSYLLKITKNED